MQKINRLKLTIPITPPLTPSQIADITASVSNLAMNSHALSANDVELTILGASETTSTHNQQQIDAATKTLNQSSAELDSAISKEKK